MMFTMLWKTSMLWKKSSKHETIDEQWKTLVVTCLLRKKHKNRNRKNTTLFVDFAENQRNRLFEASDWLLAEAPRLFLSGSLAHPRRLPQVPRSFFLRSWFFFVLYLFWPAVVFLFLCGVYFECWFRFIGSSFRWNECILQCNLCSVWVMFFVNGMSCWERSLFGRRSFPWQTCFLVKVGKRLALCTWLCGSSYSTAINASPKTSAQQTKKVSPIQNTRTIKRKVKLKRIYEIWRVIRDVKRWYQIIE